ncbi:MAG: hypothetical protein U0T02_12645 [Solirubrobacteraceae bacterium]
MQIVFGAFNFMRPAGPEMYTMTVAEALGRLGHEVAVHAESIGPLVDEARRRGIAVSSTLGELPEHADGLLAMDAPSAYALTERYPEAPLLFRVTSDVFDIGLPPRLPGSVSAIVVLAAHLERHARAFASEAEIVRLAAPVDLQRFAPRRDLPERPRRALLLGNYLTGDRRRMLVDAWEPAGVELVSVGRHGERFRVDVPAAMNEADIVVGKDRVVLEALACGRAAYVYDDLGMDGWVTPESYPALADEVFHGRATGAVPTPERLRSDLDAYSPDMGPANRDLAQVHHGATEHAHELVALLVAAGARPASGGAPVAELGWLARQNWMLESRAFDLGLEAHAAHAARSSAERERAEELRRAEAERDRARAEVARLERVLRELRESRRLRAADALARPLEWARRSRPGRP